MRMRVGQNGRARSELAEHLQDFIHTAPLFAAGIKFPVRKRPGSAFSETVIGLGVHGVLSGNQRQVFFAVVNVFSAFHHDGFYTQFDQPECGKQPAWTGTDHHRCFNRTRNIRILDFRKKRFLWLLVQVDTHPNVHIDSSLAGIDGTFHDSQSTKFRRVDAFVAHQHLENALFPCSLFR